jgi:hypothetical protein
MPFTLDKCLDTMPLIQQEIAKIEQQVVELKQTDLLHRFPMVNHCTLQLLLNKLLAEKQQLTADLSHGPLNALHQHDSIKRRLDAVCKMSVVITCCLSAIPDDKIVMKQSPFRSRQPATTVLEPSTLHRHSPANLNLRLQEAATQTAYHFYHALFAGFASPCPPVAPIVPFNELPLQSAPDHKKLIAIQVMCFCFDNLFSSAPTRESMLSFVGLKQYTHQPIKYTALLFCLLNQGVTVDLLIKSGALQFLFDVHKADWGLAESLFNQIHRLIKLGSEIYPFAAELFLKIRNTSCGSLIHPALSLVGGKPRLPFTAAECEASHLSLAQYQQRPLVINAVIFPQLIELLGAPFIFQLIEHMARDNDASHDVFLLPYINTLEASSFFDLIDSLSAKNKFSTSILTDSLTSKFHALAKAFQHQMSVTLEKTPVLTSTLFLALYEAWTSLHHAISKLRTCGCQVTWILQDRYSLAAELFESSMDACAKLVQPFNISPLLNWFTSTDNAIDKKTQLIRLSLKTKHAGLQVELLKTFNGLVNPKDLINTVLEDDGLLLLAILQENIPLTRFMVTNASPKDYVHCLRRKDKHAQTLLHRLAHQSLKFESQLLMLLGRLSKVECADVLFQMDEQKKTVLAHVVNNPPLLFKLFILIEDSRQMQAFTLDSFDDQFSVQALLHQAVAYPRAFRLLWYKTPPDRRSECLTSTDDKNCTLFKRLEQSNELNTFISPRSLLDYTSTIFPPAPPVLPKPKAAGSAPYQRPKQ